MVCAMVFTGVSRVPALVSSPVGDAKIACGDIVAVDAIAVVVDKVRVRHVWIGRFRAGQIAARRRTVTVIAAIDDVAVVIGVRSGTAVP